MTVVAKGLEGIIANSTRLSDVLGDIGQLIYAGYDINELAGKVSFEEIIHLLWYGEVPNQRQLDTLTDSLRRHRQLPLGLVEFLKSAPKDAGPMDVIRTAVSMLGMYDPDVNDTSVDRNRERAVSITARIT